MPHHDRGALGGSERIQRLFHSLRKLRTLSQALRRRRRVRRGHHRVHLQALPAGATRLLTARVLAAALAHAVDGVVRSNAVDPSPEIGVPCELPQLLVSPQECLLHHFLGVVRVSRHAIRQVVHVAAMPFDEDTIGFAVARQGALDGDGVADRFCPGPLSDLVHPHD